MSIAPTAYIARKALQFRQNGESAAAEIVEICPAEQDRRPGAYFLPGQLERVQEFQSMGGRAVQLARILTPQVTHAATQALLYRNAKLLGGCLYAGAARLQLTMKRPPRLPQRIRQTLASAALVGTPVSSVFFGHYLMDDSATTLLARDFAAVYSPDNPPQAVWTHPHDYRRMMDLQVPTLGNAALDAVWVFQDYAMNSHRRQRMQQVRQRLAGQPQDQTGHAVFILRGRSGQALRLLENEQELAETLSAQGFTVIDPMRETAADILRTIGGAALVVSVEGSAISHAYLSMQDTGAIITLQPPNRFDTVWKDYTDLLGMKYGFVVGEGGADRFRINQDDLLRTIDLIAADKPARQTGVPAG